MKKMLNSALKFTSLFMASKPKRYIFLLAVLACLSLADFLYLGLARRTFVFYTVGNKSAIVEDRMLKRSGTINASEIDIIRYTEETLLGPVPLGLMPIFPRGTKLKSLLFRDGIVYADFSGEAELPVKEGESALIGFRTLYDGILRNFSSVKDIRFFIEGQAAFYGGI